MESLRKVFLDRFLGEERPQDILQEALPNVVAAHTMQSYIGGYGQMIHPVADAQDVDQLVDVRLVRLLCVQHDRQQDVLKAG